MLACRAHVQHEFGKLRSSNSIAVRVRSVGDWWEADPESKLFRLAEKALVKEWGVQPLFVREGGTMPVSVRLPSSQKGPADTQHEVHCCAATQLLQMGPTVGAC